MSLSFSKCVRVAGAAIVVAAISMSAMGASAQRWDLDPTAYLYHTTCEDAATSRNATEIGELEDDRITLRRVWREIGTGGDRPNGMYGEIEDIDRIRDVQTLIDGDFSVVIHQDDSTRSPIIACVDVEGTLSADGNIMLQLETVDDSGFDGRVLIRPEDDDDDEVEFIVALFPASVVEPVSAATPTS